MANEPMLVSAGTLQEDRRAATAMRVTMISQFIAGSFTAISVQGAVYVFIVDKRTPIWLFHVFAVGAVAAFLASAWLGNMAITRISYVGRSGSWNDALAWDHVGKQFHAALIGILLFIMSVIVGIGFSPSREEPARIGDNSTTPGASGRAGDADSLSIVRLSAVVERIEVRMNRMDSLAARKSRHGMTASPHGCRRPRKR